MAGRKRVNVTLADYDRWWSQGYGRGEGSSYKPWMRIQDFRSKGISTRLAGDGDGTSGNEESHTFSLGERDVGNLLQFLQVPYQEQKPIYPLPEIQALAGALGIKYPTLDNGTPAVLTYDFFLPAPSVFFRSTAGTLQFKQASTFAPGRGLRRELEKLELYRRHAQTRGWGMFIVEEQLLGAHGPNTLRLLKQCSVLPKALVDVYPPEAVLAEFKHRCQFDWTLGNIRQVLATALSVSPEDALQLFKQLLWSRRLGLRLNAPFELHLAVAGLHVREDRDSDSKVEAVA